MTSENVYEFDYSSFFNSVDLEAVENIMIEKLAIPPRVAGYLTALNRSITTLQKEDLLDESNDRLVLLQPSGKANPNLPKELKAKVEQVISRPD